MENTKNLIGRKFKGFKFETNKEIIYPNQLNKLVDKELTIKRIMFGAYVWVEETNFNYPLKEVLNHLIPEEKQIPELPKGVLMLVSDDGKRWKEREVIGNYKGLILVATKDGNSVHRYKLCKPIPKLPNYTLQELKEKIGHDFNLID